MQHRNAVRPANGLFNGLMILAGFTFMLVWLPLLRCLFDGSSYSWGQWYYGLTLSSQGLSADYLFLIVFLALYVALFAAFYWAKNRMFFYGLLVIWWLHFFGNLLLDIAVHGDTMFHGDTMNVHVSLSAIVIPLALIAAVMIFLVIRKDRRVLAGHASWGRSNWIKAAIILGPLVVQAFLFAGGEPHGITDQIAVVIAIAQAILVPIIFIPARKE